MLIFPEIQVAGGRVVTRTGALAAHVVHEVDPIELLDRFVSEGAERIHIVDVDAAAGKAETNAALVEQMLQRTHVPVQVAGGMRTVAQIESWLEAGAASVVLGTLAITDPSMLADVCTRHPGAIMANLATRDGLVMIDGWKTATAFRPADIVYDLQMAGVAGIIHIDLDRFEGDASAPLALSMELQSNVVIPVYASGTVQTLDDIARIRYLPYVQGVIVGHALVTGAFSLSEALEIGLQPETRPANEDESTVAPRGIQSPTRAYLSAYSNSPASRWWNSALRQALTEENPYIEVNIPQEDLEVTDRMTRRQIQRLYESALDDADVVVVALDGVENEAWTGYECGYARATGKFLLGIAASPRFTGRSRIEDMCDDVVEFSTSDDWQTTLATIAKEVNSRLLTEHATD